MTTTPHNTTEAEALAALLAVHTYLIDGPPAVIGVRCTCGFRQYDEYMTPEGADLAARLHVATVLATQAAARDAAQRAEAWDECVEKMLCDCGNFDGHPGDCLMWELIDQAPSNPYRIGGAS